MSDKLYTDRDYFDRMFASIDKRFDGLDEKVDKINSTVAKHEKIINENLPHDISHCTQVETIEELKKNMISGKIVKKTIYAGIAIIGTLITIVWTIKELFFK